MTFTTPFQRHASTGDSISCIVNGYTFTATIEHDDDTTPPWERDDGNGIVSGWTMRGARDGERVLSQQRNSQRFYDWDATLEKAKADGWGYSGMPETEDADARALKAVEHDFAVMKASCNDEWHYVGIVLTVERNGVPLKAGASLWGIEMNYPGGDNSYLFEVANELLPEALDAAEVERNLMLEALTGDGWRAVMRDLAGMYIQQYRELARFDSATIHPSSPAGRLLARVDAFLGKE